MAVEHQGPPVRTRRALPSASSRGDPPIRESRQVPAIELPSGRAVQGFAGRIRLGERSALLQAVKRSRTGAVRTAIRARRATIAVSRRSRSR